MDKPGIFGEILEELGDTAKQAGSSLAKTPQDLAKAAASQVKQAAKGSQATQSQPPVEQQAQQQPQRDDEFIKDLYGANKQNNAQQTQTTALDTPEQKEQKLESLRKKLHDEYYQKLVNPPKP